MTTSKLSLEELLKSSVSLKSLPRKERKSLLAAFKEMTKEEKKDFHNILLAEHFEYKELQTAAQLKVMNKYLQEMDQLLKEANKSIRLESEIEATATDLVHQEDLLKELEQI